MARFFHILRPVVVLAITLSSASSSLAFVQCRGFDGHVAIEPAHPVTDCGNPNDAERDVSEKQSPGAVAPQDCTDTPTQLATPIMVRSSEWVASLLTSQSALCTALPSDVVFDAGNAFRVSANRPNAASPGHPLCGVILLI